MSVNSSFGAIVFFFDNKAHHLFLLGPVSQPSMNFTDPFSFRLFSASCLGLLQDAHKTTFSVLPNVTGMLLRSVCVYGHHPKFPLSLDVGDGRCHFSYLGSITAFNVFYITSMRSCWNNVHCGPNLWHHRLTIFVSAVTGVVKLKSDEYMQWYLVENLIKILISFLWKVH